MWTSISRGLSIAEQGADRVAVTGAAGSRRRIGSSWWRVYRDGWTASGMLAVVGRDAEAKARAAGQMILERVRRAGYRLADTLVECFGAGDVASGVVRPASPPFEVVLRVTVRDPVRAAVERFCRELAPLVTAGPPGIAGYAVRPAHAPARLWLLAGPGAPRSWPKSRVRVDVRTAAEWARSACRDADRQQVLDDMVGRDPTMTEDARSIRLGDLGHTRSGDKGNRSNIGVVARDGAAYAWLEPRLDRGGRRRFPATARDRYRPSLRSAPAPCVQLRDRACPGGGREPLAPTRHARQGAGRHAPGMPLARPGRSDPSLDPEVYEP